MHSPLESSPLRDSRGELFFSMQCGQTAPKKSLHGDGLIEPGLDIPAGPITSVRKNRVDAGHGLLGILNVGLEFRFAVLLWNGENAHDGIGFEWIRRLRVEHTDTQVGIVTAIDEGQDQCNDDQDTFCENGWRSQGNLMEPMGLVPGSNRNGRKAAKCQSSLALIDSCNVPCGPLTGLWIRA